MKNIRVFLHFLALSGAVACDGTPLTVPGSVRSGASSDQPPSGDDNSVNVGNGTDSFIAGSQSGFGVVWNDTSVPVQKNRVKFALLNVAGRKLAADQETAMAEGVGNQPVGVYPILGGYAANIRHEMMTGIVFYGHDGIQAGVLNDQMRLNLIKDSDAKAFVFLDNGTQNPLVQQGRVTPSAYLAGDIYGSALTPVATTPFGVQLGNAWAYGTQNETGIVVTIVRENGVFKSLVSMYDSQNPPAPNSFSIGDLVATDDGFVQSWYFQDGSGRHAYLSFVQKEGLADGNLQTTFETTEFFPVADRVDHLAWNGSSIGLLTISSVNGKASLFRIDKNGSRIGDGIAIVDGQQGGWLRGGLAASGSTFGVVYSAGSDQAVRFRAVNFD